MFQSLSGFQVRCNLIPLYFTNVHYRLFQSLSGFQVRCNFWLVYVLKHSLVCVSIPIGFSSSLQHRVVDPLTSSTTMFQSLSGFQVRCNQTTKMSSTAGYWCFNPYRVFKFVATPSPVIVSSVSHWFQSLSGFQVRCNRSWKVGTSWVSCRVSIPIGFSSSLQPIHPHPEGCGLLVSIPIGFSSSLQLLEFRIGIHPSRKFQSLSGFQVRCNGTLWMALLGYNPF